MKAHLYYRNSVEERRPYLQDEWCEAVLDDPERTEVQEDGRIRHWGYIPELGKYFGL